MTQYFSIKRLALLVAMTAGAPAFGADAASKAPPAAPPPATTAPAATAPAATAPAATAPAARAPADPSYSFGLSFGEQLRRLGISDELSMESLSRGVQDALRGKNTDMADNEQIRAFLTVLRDRTAERNKLAAREFLVSNRRAPGVKATASGLQYKIMNPGNAKAATPTALSQVTVHYRGTLLDGTEFDSSYKRNEPATFEVLGVIKGWQEALVLMKPGSKWQLFIPPELAYDVNSPPAIPPGSLLRFEVELLSVNTPPPEAPRP
jgi:FKBP-type peptidyl-prolyl cis-trans isomerase FklB